MEAPVYRNDAYFCYADEDREYAKFLMTILRLNGMRAVSFEDLLNPNDIPLVMDESACIVFLLSPYLKSSAAASQSVIHFITRYRGNGSFVLLSGNLRTSVPYGLMRSTRYIIDGRTDMANVIYNLVGLLCDLKGQDIPSPISLPDTVPTITTHDAALPTLPKAHHVYLSYRSRDKEHMAVLWETLLNAGLSVWVDKTLPLSVDWRAGIEEAIERAQLMVVQLSENVDENSYVLEDLAYARAHDIPIFPITLDKAVYNRDYLYRLVGNSNICDWWLESPESDRAANLKRLVSQLQEKLGVDPVKASQPAFQDEQVLPQTSTKLYDAFVSYSRLDNVFMEKMRDSMKAAGLRIWTDTAGLTSGTPDWELAIREALRASKALIYIASPDAFASRYVNGELSIADNYKLRLFPVWVRGDNWADCVPLNHIKTQFEDARSDQDGAIEKLIASLGRFLNQSA